MIIFGLASNERVAAALSWAVKTRILAKPVRDEQNGFRGCCSRLLTPRSSARLAGIAALRSARDAIQLLKLKLTQRHHIGDRESEHRRCCAPSSQQRSQA